MHMAYLEEQWLSDYPCQGWLLMVTRPWWADSHWGWMDLFHGFGSEFFGLSNTDSDHIFHVSLLSPLVCSLSGSFVDGIESNIHGPDAFGFLVENLVPRRKTWKNVCQNCSVSLYSFCIFWFLCQEICFCGFTSIFFVIADSGDSLHAVCLREERDQAFFTVHLRKFRWSACVARQP